MRSACPSITTDSMTAHPASLPTTSRSSRPFAASPSPALAKAKVSSFCKVAEASQRLGGVGAAAAALDAGGAIGRLGFGAGAGAGSVLVAEGSGEDAQAASNTTAAPSATARDGFVTGVLREEVFSRLSSKRLFEASARDFLSEIIHQS